jgi:DHA1 family bicyclomycin/chloramphenicol resistance-like MFS transporter
LSDSLGRRPVVLAGLAVFTIASVGCAMSQTIAALVFFRALQGMAAGAGIVVSRAIIRDMFPDVDAQRVMSQVTIFFGIAPAVAPMIGGLLLVHLGWHSIFWLLSAIGAALLVINWRELPETLHPAQRQPFEAGHLMRGYGELLGNPRFVMLTLASGIPFNGMFLYILSAPVFLGEHLGLAPTQFFWFFMLSIAGIMSGAWASGRLAGRISQRRQIRSGFVIMSGVSAINVALSLSVAPHPAWAMPTVAIFALGWAFMVPVVTLLVLDQAPARRGMASSLQMCIASTANGFVAGVISPLVMHSMAALAIASALMMGIGIGAWVWVERRIS